MSAVYKMGEKRKNPDGTYKGKWKDFYTRDKSVKWKQVMTSDRRNEDGSYNKTGKGKDWGSKYKGAMVKSLTDKQYKKLEDIYYFDGGFRGRDQMWHYMQKAESKTPGSMVGISKNQMYKYFLQQQETQQRHRDMPQKSLSVKPILEKEKFGRVQADLIIKAKVDSGVKAEQAILSVIDVATRKGWARVLNDKGSKNVFANFKDILSEVKLKPKIVMTDNGPEFEKEFRTGLKKMNIRQLFGIPNRSNSQAHVERFNKSLQSSLQKDLTSSRRKDWFNLVESHVKYYNDKPNINVKLRKPSKEGDPPNRYRYYTPNELWEVGNTKLRELYEKQKELLTKQHKPLKGEAEVKVGDKVRVADFAKRKNVMGKGFKTNWSKRVYTVSRVRKPKDDTRPYVYFVVDDKEKPFKQKRGKEAQMLTIKDILPLPKDRDGKPMPVKKPPERLRKEADDEWKTTPSSDEETESESEDDDIPEFDPEVPKDKEKKKEKQVIKQKKVKQQHTYIGRQVKSGRMPGATSDITKTTGTIYKRTPALGAVSNAYFHIKWDNGDAEEKFKYGQVRNGKNILKSLLGDI
jgi:hypothetical protein